MFQHNHWGEFGGYGRHGGWRARRGDMGPIILSVLKEKPMHGYEIISRLEEQSHGMWRPSAGSVYPNLQLLEEQDLVSSKEEDGKKTYSLTDKGKEEAEKHDEAYKENWEKKAAYAKNFKEMKGSIVGIMHSLKKIAPQESEKKMEEVKKMLDDLNERLAKLADS